MWIIIVSETLFFIDIVLSFFKQELDEEGISKSEPLSKISYKYLTNGFIIDFITFLPIGYFFEFVENKLQFLWAIKAMRIRTLNIQMSDRVLLPIIYSYIEKYQRFALKDPYLRNDIT